MQRIVLKKNILDIYQEEFLKYSYSLLKNNEAPDMQDYIIEKRFKNILSKIGILTTDVDNYINPEIEYKNKEVIFERIQEETIEGLYNSLLLPVL